PMAVSFSLYLTAFLPPFAGMVSVRSTPPSSQEKVEGRPGTGLLEANVHSLAPETDALTVVLPPEMTVAGRAAKPETTGFGGFAPAGVASAAIPTHAPAVANIQMPTCRRPSTTT